VTVTNPSAPSFLTAYPSGTAKPTASNLNFASGQTIANLAVVKLGTGGALDLTNAVGTTDVVLDVVGWFGTSFNGNGFFGVNPTRILDSRIGLGLPGKIGAAAVQVTGVGGVPVTGVTAVVVNLTATNATVPSYIITWPWGSPPTGASTVNFAAGQTIPNLAVLKVGQDGKVGIGNAAGLTDVVGDVVGYYTS